MEKKGNGKIISQNKKAWHEYFVEETYEAGIELFGTEVKSLRAGNVNLKDAYCSIDNGELFVRQMHVSPYEHGNIFNRDPLRPRKLLMHKREILKLFGLVAQKGYTLVPLQLYFKGSNVKVQVGLCKGKKLHDKREDMAKRDADGFIYLVDRKKDVIITGGENLYPVQIEDFLHTNKKIKDVAVIGLPDERLGEIAVAIIELIDGATCTQEEIDSFCMDLPRYKRPRKIIFAEVPRNPTGKIEKPKLREKYCSVPIVELQTTK